MSLLVLSYPTISEKDLNWIQKIRAEYDRLHYKIIPAHFTIVFAVSDIEQESFIGHVKKQAQGVAKIAFVLRSAVVVKDILSEYTYVFLVPDEGQSEIVKLHDRLYRGDLASELRPDIPFIPHVSVGNSTDQEKCRRLAQKLNQEPFAVKGFIETLDIVKYKDDTAETIERIILS